MCRGPKERGDQPTVKSGMLLGIKMSVRHDCSGEIGGAGAGHARRNRETNFLPRPRWRSDNSQGPTLGWRSPHRSVEGALLLSAGASHRAVLLR